MGGYDRHVTFYFGLGSRYSYLAYTQISRVEAEVGVAIEWRPIISGQLMASINDPPFKWDSEVQDWSGAKVSGQYRESYRQQDLKRWASYYGVSYQEPKPPVINIKRRTLYCVAAAKLGAGADYATRIFEDIYVKGAATEEETCISLAAAVDLDPDDLRGMVDSGGAEQVHDMWVKDALTLGVFGVPTFVHGGAFYWGNDRLPLLIAALR